MPGPDGPRHLVLWGEDVAFAGDRGRVERNYRMELQYDGTGLHGWARQAGLATVEGCLSAALATVLGHAPVLRVAGRTDAGVHARRQVVSLRLPTDTDPVRLVRSLNALTPPGIGVTRLVRAPATFDARKDATSRSYRYFLSNAEVVSPFWARFCWHVHGGLDPRALHAAAALVRGRHDFTAFTPTETEHVFFDRSVIRCAWGRVRGGLLPGVSSSGVHGRASSAGASAAASQADRSGDPFASTKGVVYLEIEAGAFLRHMVRTLVGTMVEVARGERTLEDLGRLLLGAPREEAGPTAPAHGLFLWDVRYGAPRTG